MASGDARALSPRSLEEDGHVLPRAPKRAYSLKCLERNRPKRGSDAVAR
jgi:hypothetical protein